MKGSLRKLLNIGLWTSIVLFAIRCLISMPEGVYDIFSHAGEAITIALFSVWFYECFLWKYIPFEKTPRIAGQYDVTLEYMHEDKKKSKKATAVIKQTLSTVRVIMKTDKITSSTIVSSLLEENGENILYYTYITQPKSGNSQENPIQQGTCRLLITDNEGLCGTYWTSRKTIGDITLKRSVA